MKKPTPEDFGIPAKQYEGAAAEYRRLHNKLRGCPEPGECMGVAFGLTAIAAWYGTIRIVEHFYAPRELPDYMMTLLIFLFGPCVGMVAGGVVAYLVLQVVSYPRAKYRNELAKPLFIQVRRYEEAVEQYEVRQKRYWLNLRGTAFEKKLAGLYRKLGYVVRETKGSRDGGVDLYLRKDGKSLIVQCKGHKKPIGVAAARDLYGTLVHRKVDAAILACPAGFTDGVRTFAKGKPIELIAAKELVAMVETVS